MSDQKDRLNFGHNRYGLTRSEKENVSNAKCTSCGKEISGKPYIYEPTLKPYCKDCIGEASMS
jgi:hypothetical protein